MNNTTNYATKLVFQGGSVTVLSRDAPRWTQTEPPRLEADWIDTPLYVSWGSLQAAFTRAPSHPPSTDKRPRRSPDEMARECARHLDKLHAPLDITQRAAQRLLRDHDVTPRNAAAVNAARNIRTLANRSES